MTPIEVIHTKPLTNLRLFRRKHQGFSTEPGFQSLKTASATLKGFEVMRMFKKGQMNRWIHGDKLK